MGDKAVGFNRFFCYKEQASWGTKQTGLASTMIPLRSGAIFEPNPILQPREDAIYTMSPLTQYYTPPKFVPWSASFLLISSTSAAPVLRDFFRAVYGKELTAAGPPVTKTYNILDPPIDGGTDGTPVNTLYAHGLTLHEQCDNSAGTAIYSHEVQDAVVSELSVTWRPDQPVLVSLRGMASDLQDGSTDISPTIPGGPIMTYRHVKDTTSAGLYIGTANPPVTANDNVIFSQATLTISNPLRYVPFMGNGSTKEARIPLRDGQMSITLDVTMDVEAATASLYDASDIVGHWKAGTGVNVNFLTYITANDIFQFQTTAATAGCYIESFRNVASSLGAMQHNMKLRVAPAALADTLIKLTSAT